MHDCLESVNSFFHVFLKHGGLRALSRVFSGGTARASAVGQIFLLYFSNLIAVSGKKPIYSASLRKLSSSSTVRMYLLRYFFTVCRCSSSKESTRPTNVLNS